MKRKCVMVALLLFVLVNNLTCYSQNEGHFLNDISIDKQEVLKAYDSHAYEYDWDVLEMVVVKTADWSNCPLSEKFLKKYNNIDSILKEYDVIRLDSLEDNEKLNYSNFEYSDNKYLYRILLRDGSYRFCLFKVIRDCNRNVDDILTYVVPRDKEGLSYEQMYALALND